MATHFEDYWWKHAVIYQIYPLSFKDNNGDGMGDLQGIHNKLEYLKEIGVTAIWLSPIFKSPMVDFGYDISDYRDVNSIFGTLEDFDHLVAHAKLLDIKILLDFVPNHTSDQHDWFKKSVKRVSGFEDYYVWKDAVIDVDGNEHPPNNWRSAFGNRAWTFHKARGQYYLHHFAPEQPDLNFRNPQVVEEMKNILLFWLKRGVAGFRIDAVPFLFEDEDFRNEPLSHDINALPMDYNYLEHIYTNHLPETYSMIYEWRKLLDDYSRKTDKEPRVMFTEAYGPIKKQMLYYGDEHRQGAHFTFNFLLITNLCEKSDAYDFTFTINKWLSYVPYDCVSNWQLGNHDQHRVGTRYGSNKIDGLNMLLMMLPGTAVTYYGDEIGMVDGNISWEETKDPSGLNAGPERYKLFSRDPERTPMQWDNSRNAGFSTAENPWLPLASNYAEINVEQQRQRGVRSHLKVYTDMIILRRTETLKTGEIRIKPLSKNVLSLTRELSDFPIYVYIFNLGPNEELVDLSRAYKFASAQCEVLIASVNAEFEQGKELNLSGFKIGPYTAYILEI